MKAPPQLAQNILKWFAGRAEIEDIKGDLDEVFYHQVLSVGRWKACRSYYAHVFSLLFSYGLKKRKRATHYSIYYVKNSHSMLKNYIKLAYRNLKKQKAFTIINVLGLAMGMSVSLLALSMYLELKQFDTFHPSAQNTYRIITEIDEGGDINTYASAPPALTYRLGESLPEISTSVHINDRFFPVIEHEGNEIKTQGYFTQPSFFDVFAFTIATGTANALNEPGNVIITKELSEKLFGEDEAMGQVLQTQQWGQLKVAGVLKEFPKRTHLSFDILVGYPSNKQLTTARQLTNWVNFRSNYYYFTLHDDTQEHVSEKLAHMGSAGASFFEVDEKSAAFELQPLSSINPGELMGDSLGLEFDMASMLFFIGLSLLILAPACFNYTNMSIAIALKRSKEVGIRKVMGSHKQQIMGQFLVETILICLLAVTLSAIIFQVIKTEWLSMLVGGEALIMDISLSVGVLFVLFAVVTGLLTGLGPALYFAKITPINALRSHAGSQSVSISGIRKGLLVFQFSLTLIFMIGIGVLLKQYQESRAFEYPMNTEETFVIPTQGQDIQLIRQAYTKLSGVENVSFSSSIPGTPLTQSQYIYFDELQDSLRVRVLYSDTAFIRHMRLEMVAGNSTDISSQHIESVLANEEMMRTLRNVKAPDSTLLNLGDGRMAHVKGIIKDYNHEPLNESIEPMLICRDDAKLSYALVTMGREVDASVYRLLESQWYSYFSNTSFEASLLKHEIDKAYMFFKVGLKIFGFLALLAISISCLGLLGMVIFATENRVKEVAIRKILGANKGSLFGTLTGLFIKLWGIAMAIAIPLSYIFYDKVLIRMFNKFSDGVGFTEIALSVLTTLLLGGLAIYWQVNKISGINPATNLRND